MCSRLAMAAGSVILAMFAAAPAYAASCGAAVSFGAPFAASGYACNSIGGVSGLTSQYGGLTFLDNSTLLIGGDALNSAGTIEQVGVIRDAGNHVIGFSGPATSFAAAPGIDGGLAFGPGGVLFYTNGVTNQLGEIKPGSTAADKLATLPANLNSGGSLVFVPPGFAGAGGMKLLGFGDGKWYDVTLLADGNGTYDVAATPGPVIGSGPEGAVYVGGANAGFNGTDSVIVSEFANNQLTAIALNASGVPDPSTATPFLTGLADTEGAVIDPLTGDELFVNRDSQVTVITGFLGPAVPEPGTVTLFGLGLAGLGLLRRRGRLSL
jgi:hypothetical protein